MRRPVLSSIKPAYDCDSIYAAIENRGRLIGDLHTNMKLPSLCSLMVLSSFLLSAQSFERHVPVPLNNWSAQRQVMRSQLRTGSSSPTPQLQLPSSTAADTLIFVPIAPCRLADTRPGQGYPALGSTPLSGLSPRNLAVAGLCGVPSGLAQAFSLNVTAVPASGTLGGYVVLYPNPATPVPLVASLTWSAGAAYQTAAVIVAASHDGSVNVAANFTSDVVVDINGYYAPPTDSSDNTALGSNTLTGSSGDDNTAVGYQALANNGSGQQNTAVGMEALTAETTGIANTGVGAFALASATSGSFNIALGQNAGDNITTGGSNIMIGNQGTSSDSQAIRIGSTQTVAYMAGIYGSQVINGASVYIDPNGHLGTSTTTIFVGSLGDKQEVHDMGDASAGLLRLRPVTYRESGAGSGATERLHYGLIATQVADVFPDLVQVGKRGQVESAREAELPVMLLNELQRQYRHSQQQDEAIREAQQQLAEEKEQNRKLEARLAALEATIANMAPTATADTASNKAAAAAVSPTAGN